MTYTISPHMNGSKMPKASQDWLYASVQDFFSGFNWDDHPPEVQPTAIASDAKTAEPLSLTMSVRQFFAAINWDGTSAIAAEPVLPLQESAAKAKINNFTLDEFSDLF